MVYNFLILTQLSPFINIFCHGFVIFARTFPDTAKVWIYQASRALTPDENQLLSTKAKAFASGWTAHKMALQADAAVVNNLLLLLIVDENQASVSGCSIDSSVHFVKEIGAELGVDFFNRLNVAYLQQGTSTCSPFSNFSGAN
jgi:hypothetical protein